MNPTKAYYSKNFQPVWRALQLLILILIVCFPAASVQAQTGSLEFTPDWGPQMVVGESWITTFNASGGTGNYTYGIISGAVPGITLLSGSVSATYSGIPTTSGTYSITVRVTDSATPTPNSITATHTYYVANPLVFSPEWGDQMFVGDDWSATYTASGGVTPYSYSLTTGNIPGVTFDSDNVSATYSGNPTTIGSYPISVQVTDSGVGGGDSVTASHTYIVMSHTNLEITDFASSHPMGEFRLGYTIWVLVNLNADVDVPASPAQEVLISSDNGGPSCTAEIAVDGTGECALTFVSVGSYNISATFAGSTYFEASSTSQSIQILADDRVKSLSAGRNHTCLLDETGNISCWGLDDSYTLKDSNGSILSDVTDGTYSQMSAGGYHTCAIDNQGEIHCWGDSVDIINPDVIPNIVDGKNVHYISIDAGDDHVCAIDTKFRLHCWGEIIPEIQSGIPTSQVKMVSVGETNDCVVGRSNDRVSCWGLNGNNQLAVPTNLEVVRLDVGNTHTCAIRKNDNHVVCWGTPTMTLPTTTAFAEISSGSNYSCGLTDSNQIQCWGTNSIVSITPATANFDTISSGAFHSCAIQTGSGGPFLKCWGNNAYGQAPALTLSPQTLPEYLPLLLPWSQDFTAGGGNEPYSLVANSGLPTGITLNTFQLSGSPSAAGSFTFTLTLNESFPVADGSHPLQLAPVVQTRTITVKDPHTTIQISDRDNNVPVGSPVNVTVNVTKVGGSGNPVIAGTVTITGHESISGRTAECTATVTEVGGVGTASCAVYFGESGDAQQITAVYNGDSFYLAGNNTASTTTIITPIVINPSISAGNNFSCSIDGNGNAYCWGDNDSGQTDPYSYNYKSLSSGDSHVCAIGVNSQIFCWGWNGYGMVSARPTTYGFLSVASGQTHSCALTDQGTIRCWGNSLDGRLSVPSRSDYTQVDAGDYHTCALTTDGTPYCWGNNSYGQTTISSSSKFKTISAGGLATCGINMSNQIECWGERASFLTTIPAGSFLAVSNGYAHACALDLTNQIHCWGEYPDTITGSFSSVSSGSTHNCALTSPDGYLKCWGDNDFGQAPVIELLPEVFPVLEVNQYWSSIVTASGARTNNLSFFRTGNLPNGLSFTGDGNIFGTPSVGNDFTFTIRAIEADLSPALIQDITYTQRVKGDSVAAVNSLSPATPTAGKPVTITIGISTADNNLFSEPASGNVELEANGEFLCQAELQSGTAVCTVYFSTPGEKSIVIRYDGDERFLTTDNLSSPEVFEVQPYSQELKIFSGAAETYIHKSDGSINCIGANCQTAVFNQLYTAFGVGAETACALKMDGNLLCRQNEVSTLVIGPFIDMSVGSDHTCALDSEGNAQCWGANDLGQSNPPIETFSSIFSGNGASCGLRSSDQTPLCWGNLAAVSEPGIALSALTVGDGHACAISPDGALICWGANDFGQSDAPAGALFTSVTSGDQHSCALDNTGEISCWGVNDLGQRAAPYGAYTAVDGFGNHTCALRSADEITCWGDNENGAAPQIQVIALDPTETVVNEYWEHFFSPSGGEKPYTAEVVSGNLPVGVMLETDTVISPAGVVAYGTPTNPARYDFVIRWMDAGEPHLVLDVPYHLTVTGADLAVDIIAAHADTALKSNEFYFDYVFTNHTPLDIPDVLINIVLPTEGWQDLTLSGMSDCVLDGVSITCEIAALPALSEQTLRVRGLVAGDVGIEMATSAEINPTLENWPEINPLDNSDETSVQIGYSSLGWFDDFGGELSAVWSGGNRITAPSGEIYLENAAPGSQSIRLLIDPIAPHKKLRVSFDLYIIGPWQGNGEEGISDPALFDFGVSGLTSRITTTFCNLDGCTQAYPGRYPLSAYPAFSGAVGLGELGYDPDTISEARYHIELSLVHQLENIDLTWLAQNLAANARFGLDNVIVTLDSGWNWTYLPNITR